MAGLPAAGSHSLQESTARGGSHLLPPSPESCSLGTAPEVQGAQGWELRLAKQSFSPGTIGRGLMSLFQDKFSTKISVGFRGIRGRSTCSCLVSWQVQDSFNSFWVTWIWVLNCFFTVKKQILSVHLKSCSTHLTWNPALQVSTQRLL